jgi:zinc transporter
MYALSVTAAIFLPLGLLTGLLGINVAGIPGAEYKGAFAIFCGLLVLIAVLQILLYRRLSWL